MKGKYSDKEHFKFATHSLRGAKGVAGGTQKVTKSTAFEVLKAKTAAAEDEENRYIAVQPKEVPAAPTEPIKMTAAAVLREDAMYQKKQEQEAAAIEKYESELRDASEYESWKARMEVAENDEKLKEVQDTCAPIISKVYRESDDGGSGGGGSGGSGGGGGGDLDDDGFGQL